MLINLILDQINKIMIFLIFFFLFDSLGTHTPHRKKKIKKKKKKKYNYNPNNNPNSCKKRS